MTYGTPLIVVQDILQPPDEVTAPMTWEDMFNKLAVNQAVSARLVHMVVEFIFMHDMQWSIADGTPAPDKDRIYVWVIDQMLAQCQVRYPSLEEMRGKHTPKPVEPPKLPKGFTPRATWCTKGKLNRMFKYYRGSKVDVRYEYNNSMGGHEVREILDEVYDSFTIEEYYPRHHRVKLIRNGTCIFEHEFDDGWGWEGPGKMWTSYGGPRCYFTISKS